MLERDKDYLKKTLKRDWKDLLIFTCLLKDFKTIEGFLHFLDLSDILLKNIPQVHEELHPQNL